MTAAGEQYHAFRMPSLQWRTSVLLVFTTLCFACGVCLAQEVGGYPGRASASSGDRFAQALEQQQSDDSRPSHLLLACLLDGTVAALDASTGHTLWSLTTGGALIQTRFSASTTARLERPSGGTAASSGEQADASGRMPGDSLAHNTSLHAERSTASGGTMGSILPGTDGSLYLFRESTGLQRLPYGVREVVTSAPRLSPDGRIISGRKDSIFFRVDSVTGTVQYGHSSKSGSVGVADQGEDGEETGGADSGSDLFVGRSDFRLHIFDGSTGSEFLNLSYAELQLQVFEKSKGHVEETEESIATDEEIAALGLSLSGSLLSRRAAPLWAGAAAGSSAAASVAPGQAFEDAHRSQDTDKQRNKHAWNADLGAPIMALYDLRSGGCDGHVCRADPRSAAGGARRSTCAGERCQLKNVNQSPVLRKLPIKTISEVDMDEIVLEAGGDEGTWAPQTKRQRKKKSLFRRLLDRLGSRACGNERHSCARSRSSSLMRAVALQNGYADSEEGDIVYIGKTVLGDLYVDQAQAFQRVLRGEMPLSVSDRTAKALRHSPEVGVHVGRRYTATYALPLPTSHGGSSARSLGARTSPASPKSSASVPEAQDGADGTRASMGEFFSGRGADEGGAIHDVPEPALASFLSYKMTSLVAERPWLVLIAGAFVFFFVRLLTTVWSQNTVQIVVAETDAGKAAVEPEATPAAAGSQGVQANAGALVASEAANRAVPLRERGVAQSAADDEVEASASPAENVELLLDLPRGSSAPAAIPGGSENQVRVLPEQVISDSVAADAAPSSPSASDVSVSPRPASAPANVEGLGRSRGPSTDSAPSRASESGDEQVSRSRFDEDFEEVGVLGKGAFGRVVIARNRLDGAEYAVKKIPVLSSLLSQQRRERMLREVTALAKLDHANIVRYYQAWIEDKPLEQDYEWIFGSSGSLYAGSGHKGELDDSAVSDVFGGALDSGLPGGLLEETGSALSTRDGSLLHPGGSMPASPSGSLASRRGGQGAGFARRRGAGAHRDSGESLFAREDAVESGGAESPWSLRETPSPASEEGLRHDLQHLELASRLEQLGTALKPSVCTPQGSASCGSPCSEGLDGDGAASPSSSSSSSGDSTNSVPFSITDDGESSSIAFGATADSAGTASSRSQDRPEVFMLYIQMQLCGGGTLKEFLSRRAHEERGVDTAEALRVFAQIAEGVAYIHSHGLIHRDLKPSNILFSSEDVVKLGDFGLSKRADTQRTPDGTLDGRLGSGRTPAKSEPANLALKEAARWDGSASRRGKSGTRGIGTPLYAAPELEAGHPIPAEWQDRADVYSLGILLFELFSDFGTDMERIRSVSQLRRGILPASFRKTYPRESKLILSMCALRPENRPDAGTVVQSEALRPHYMSQALLSRAPSAISGGGDDSSSQPSYIFVAVQATNSPSVYPDITSVLVDAKRRIAASNTYVDGDTVRLEFSLVADDEDASSSLGGKEGGGANQSSKAVWESIRKRLHRVAGVMGAEVHA